MMESLLKRIERNRKEHERLVALILCLSMIVSLGVFTGFRKDAVAKTYTQTVLDCPYAAEGAEPVAHTHGTDCFDENNNLICTLPELEAHEHSDECFTESKTLVCELEENPGHAHTDECYTAETTLVCTLEESEGHQHTEDCYTLERGDLICENTDENHEHTDECFAWNEVLSCGMEAGEGAHAHSDDCYQTVWIQICGMEEGEGAHTHTEDCYLTEQVLTCEKEVLPVHVHDENCLRQEEITVEDEPEEQVNDPAETPATEMTVPEMPVSDPNADLETADIWERDFDDLELSGNWAEDLITVAATQEGNGESGLNFIATLNDAGDAWVRNGYTRYGAWYGTPYAEWSALFVSFCLRYAGIPEENVPNNPTAALMAESFSKGDLFAGADYTPAAGDLIFFDTDEEEGIDHMGIVLNIDEENNSLTTVEGDRTDEVTTFDYAMDDEEIVGYGILPQNPDYVPTEEKEENTEENNDPIVKPEETADPEKPAEVTELTADGLTVKALDGTTLPEDAAPSIAVVEDNKEAVWNQLQDLLLQQAQRPKLMKTAPKMLMNTAPAASNTGSVSDYAVFDIGLGTEETLDGMVQVTVDGLNIDTLANVPENATVTGVNYTLYHIHDDAVSTPAVEVEEENGIVTAFTFESDNFSQFVLSYTVDFEYTDPVTGETFAWKWPGGGRYAVADILKAVGITGEITGIKLERIVDKGGPDNALYLAGEYLVSDEAFTDTFRLTVSVGKKTCIFIVTDDPVSSTDLNKFIQNLTIKGLQTDENGNYKVRENETYEIMLNFKEGNTYQFDNAGTMTYQLPTGVTLPETITDKPITIRIGSGSNSYDVGAYFSVTENGEVSLRFDQNDPNYDKLTATTNVSVNLDMKVQISQNISHESWNGKVDKDITIDNTDYSDAFAQKQGYYDENTGIFYYTITVSASGGNPTNVHVRDVISGNALIFDNNVTVGSHSGTLTDNSTTGMNGFDYTFSSMQNGETITIQYTAHLDPDVAKTNPVITVDDTKNTVTVKKEGGDPHTGEYSQEINLKKPTKGDAQDTGEVDEHGNKIYSWTVIYNDKSLISVAGDTITDTIGAASQEYMQYYGDVELRVYNHEGAYAEENPRKFTPGDGLWTYTVPASDTEPYKYIFTYKTIVDKDKVKSLEEDLTLTNEVVTPGGSDGGNAFIHPGDKSSISKEVVSSSTSEISWNTTVHVSENGLNTAVVTDTFPYIHSNNIGLEGNRYLYDALQSGTLQITGLLNENGVVEGYDVTYPEVESKRQMVIEFYYMENGEKHNGLKGVTGGHEIGIAYKTDVNQEWLEAGYAYPTTYQSEHVNKVKLNDGPDQQASVRFVEPKLEKKGEKKGEGVYKYTVYLSNVTSEPVTVQDKFDRNLLEMATEYASPDDNSEYLYITGGTATDQLWPNKNNPNVSLKVNYSDTPDGIVLIAGSVPKQANGEYWPAYKITYFLKLKDGVTADTLDTLAAAEGGTYELTNKAYWGDHESSFTFDTDYDALKKEILETPQKDQDGKITNLRAKYRITFNPKKSFMNDGADMVLTDRFNEHLSMDYTSIKITTDPAENGDDVSYVLRGDGKDTVAEYTVPDGTSVVIEYYATVTGSGSFKYENTVSYGDENEVVSKDFSISIDGGGIGEIAHLKIVKVNGYNGRDKLQGVQFKLYAEDRQTNLNKDSNSAPFYEMTLTTDGDGMLDINGEDILLYFDKKYILEEIDPLPGYMNIGKYEFRLTDNPAQVDYPHYLYYANDSFQIKNWPLEGLIIEKEVDSDDPDDLETTYRFRITLYNKDDHTTIDTTQDGKHGDVTFENGVATFTLWHKKQRQILGLLAGTWYKVEELDDEGSVVSVSYSDVNTTGTPVFTPSQSYSAELTDAEYQIVKFKNTIKSTKIKANKEWIVDGSTDWPADVAVELSLWKGSDAENLTQDGIQTADETPVPITGEELVRTLTSNQQNGEWTNLYKYLDGTKYFVKERVLKNGTPVTDYIAFAMQGDGTYTPTDISQAAHGKAGFINVGKMDAEFTKEWENTEFGTGTDSHADRKNLRIKVQLHRYYMKDGVETETSYTSEELNGIYKEVTLRGNAENYKELPETTETEGQDTWTAKWEDLPVAGIVDGELVEFIYKVRENGIQLDSHHGNGSVLDDYLAIVSSDGMTITNYYKTSPVEVEKTWTLGPDQTMPTDLTLVLTLSTRERMVVDENGDKVADPAWGDYAETGTTYKMKYDSSTKKYRIWASDSFVDKLTLDRYILREGKLYELDYSLEETAIYNGDNENVTLRYAPETTRTPAGADAEVEKVSIDNTPIDNSKKRIEVTKKWYERPIGGGDPVEVDTGEPREFRLYRVTHTGSLASVQFEKNTTDGYDNFKFAPGSLMSCEPGKTILVTISGAKDYGFNVVGYNGDTFLSELGYKGTGTTSATYQIPENANKLLISAKDWNGIETFIKITYADEGPVTETYTKAEIVAMGGKPVGEAFHLGANESWHDFNLPRDDGSGNEYTYYVVETEAADDTEYESVTNTIGEGDAAMTTVSWTVKNYRDEPIPTSIDVEKKWQDSEGADVTDSQDKVDSIQYELYQNATIVTVVKPATINVTGGATYGITGWGETPITVTVTGTTTNIVKGSDIQIQLKLEGYTDGQLVGLTIDGGTIKEDDYSDVYPSTRTYKIENVQNNIVIGGNLSGTSCGGKLTIEVSVLKAGTVDPNAPTEDSTVTQRNKVGTITLYKDSSPTIDFESAFANSGITVVKGTGNWSSVIDNLPLHVPAETSTSFITTDYTYTVKEIVPDGAEYVQLSASEGVAVNVGGTATLTNQFKDEKGSVKVKKVFEGITANQLPADFQIVASWNDGTEAKTRTLKITGGTSYDDVAMTGNAFPNYEWIISDLPLDTVVTFTETGIDVAGYSVTANGKANATTATATATVAKTPGEATFTNTYTPKIGSVDFTQKKVFTNGAGATAFGYTITEYTDNTYGTVKAVITNTGSMSAKADGVTTVNYTLDDVGDHYYIVKENLPAGTTVSEADKRNGYIIVSGIKYDLAEHQYVVNVSIGNNALVVKKDETTVSNIETSFTNEQLGKLTVTKSLALNPTDDGTFQTTNKDKAYTVTITTGEDQNVKYLKDNGMLSDTEVTHTVSNAKPLVIGNVPEGTYTVTEQETGRVIEGYKFDGVTGDPADFQAAIKGDEKTVALTNTYEESATNITILKVKDDGTGLDGATFMLTKEGGDQTFDPQTTTSGGAAQFTGLKAGSYVLTESGVPKDYDGIGGNITFTLTEVDGVFTIVRTDETEDVTLDVSTFTITVTNHKLTDIKVTKEWKNSEGGDHTSQLGDTITFTLYSKTGETTATVAEDLVVTYQKDGSYAWKNNALGTLTGGENAAGWGTTSILGLPKFASDGTTPIEYYVAESATSEQNVNIETTYRVGSGTAGANTNATVTDDTEPVVIINQDVDASTSIKIIKVDAQNNATKLKNAIFSLQRTHNAAGTAIKDEADTQTTNGEGEATFGNLQGGTYKLTEVQSPAGYKTSFELAIFTVTRQNNAMVVTYTDSTDGVITYNSTNREFTITNDAIVDIEATKIWKQSDGTTDLNETLADAEVTFTLWQKVGDGEWKEARDIDDYQVILKVKDTADADAWKTSWTGLPKYDGDILINYKVVESAAKMGDVDIVLPETIEAEADNYETVDGHSNPTAQVNLTNTLPTTTVEGTKTWNVPGDLPADPMLKLTRVSAKVGATDEVVQNADTMADLQPTWSSGEGSVRNYIFTDLPKYDNEGYEYTYTVKEVSFTYADVDYVIREDKVYKVTEGADTDELADYWTMVQERNNITNTLAPVSINIIKVQKGTDIRLPNAEFQLTRKISGGSYELFENEKFASNPETNKNTGPFTVTNGEITITDLVPGDYKLKETKAPDGYIIAIGEITFTINIDGTVAVTGRTADDAGNFTYSDESNNMVTFTQKTGTSVAKVTVENTPGTALPQTGGIGTRLFTALGGLMTATAGAILTIRRKKKTA